MASSTYPELAQRLTRPSFLCNFGCKEREVQIRPGYFIIECVRCNEILSVYITFDLGTYAQ